MPISCRPTLYELEVSTTLVGVMPLATISSIGNTEATGPICPTRKTRLPFDRATSTTTSRGKSLYEAE